MFYSYGVILKKTNYSLSFFIATVLGFLCGVAWAANPIYGESVLVKDKSDSEWHFGVNRALEKVFIKVSGNDGVNTLQKISDMSDDDSLVEQFNYEKIDNQTYLKVSFDIDKVNEILKNAGQVIWSGSRPVTLVWFVNDAGGEGLFLSDQDSGAKVFRDAASHWGIDLIFPMNDLSYMSLIESDINSEKGVALLKSFSQKYNVDQILFGSKRVSEDSGYDWKLVTNDAEYDWTYEDPGLNDNIKSSIDHLVRGMVARNAVFQGDSLESKIKIGVGNVTDLGSYQKLINFIKKSPIVSNFAVLDVHSDYVEIEVDAKGGGIALADYIQKNKKVLTINLSPEDYSDVDMLYKMVVS